MMKSKRDYPIDDDQFDPDEFDDEDDDLEWWTFMACVGLFCGVTSIIGTIQIVQWIYRGIKIILN